VKDEAGLAMPARNRKWPGHLRGAAPSPSGGTGPAELALQTSRRRSGSLSDKTTYREVVLYLKELIYVHGRAFWLLHAGSDPGDN
jgi:hypothetical protein